MKDYRLSEIKEDCIQFHIDNIRILGTDVCFWCKNKDWCGEAFGSVKPCNWGEIDEKDGDAE